MKNTVIYHRADFDGLFCREIARKFLPPDTELIGWHYGDTLIPMPPEGVVYILDLSPECIADGDKFSVQVETMKRVIWIDHHKSAIEKFATDFAGYRIDGVAACRLAWLWFTGLERFEKQSGNGLENMKWFQEHYPFATKQDFVDRKVSEPLAVRLAGEYDIWDKRDPRAELFQHGLRSRDMSEELWRTILDDGGELAVDLLLKRGEAIQFAQTEQNKYIITSYGFDFQFEGLTFLCCNHARYNSQLFTAGQKPHHDALMGFKWTGKFWEFSLYHAIGKEHHDLSLIAAKHGGGGHKGACGFRVNSGNPLDFLLAAK